MTTLPGALSYVRELAGRCAQHAPKSKQIAAEAGATLTAPAIRGRFRLPLKEALFRIAIDTASGARIRDIDGNEYVDMLMGFGVSLFGHNPPFIVDAVREQLTRGFQIGFQDAWSPQVSRDLRSITSMERVFFCNSGTEAVLSAVRIARSVTRREKVAFFSGSYHGYGDSTLVVRNATGAQRPSASGVATSSAEDAIVLDYGSDASLEELERRADEIAIVLVEPVQRSRLGVQPRAYLHKLRELATTKRFVLCFDEILTGFRIAPGGAQEHFGVSADLATYGKVLGGGLAIGAVAGRASLMDAVDGGSWNFGDDSVPIAPTTFVAGTFSKHPLAMAAANAVLQHLKAEGPSLQQQLNERGRAMSERCTERLQALDLPYRMVSFGSMIGLEERRPLQPLPIPGPPIHPSSLIRYEMLLRGFNCSGDANFVISTAHDERDCNEFIDALVESVRAITAAATAT